MGKKILVVDDSATVRQQVGAALAQAGFEMVDAADGNDGMEKLRTVADIALIICDVNMPQLNGLEMLEKVRADKGYAAIPVVMLTTEGQPELVDRAKKAGAKG